MEIYIEQIAGQFSTAFDQVGTHPAISIAALFAVVVSGLWFAAEVFEFFDNRRRLRGRFALRS
jgi:uncharacterized membrane protein SpoIIM required for sporulation